MSKVRGVGRKTLQELAADSFFFRVPLKELAGSYSELKSFVDGSKTFDAAIQSADFDITEAKRLNHHIVSISDASYPKLLRNISDRPTIIYVSGDISHFSDKSIAIIGTRDPSNHGVVTAARITKYFANRGWQIVSGLAIGIDSVAHETTLLEKGSTVAVLAHGLDTVYPRQNQSLAEKIVAMGGLLITEYSYGTPSFPANFVERDRIQAALARAVVMVQSDETGGSWHASRAALKYKRHLIVPHPTKTDISARNLKIRGNLKIFESNSIDRSTFLKCSQDDLCRLLLIESKDDYVSIERQLMIGSDPLLKNEM